MVTDMNAQPIFATGELTAQREKLEVVANHRVHLGDPTSLGPRLDIFASSTSTKQPWYATDRLP
eukprot:7058237-Heterocapsa_arctica.AAC.1